PTREVTCAPAFLQIPYVQTSYRVNLSIRQCLWSLLTLHNDSINIWTHLFGT
ncbi:unnamed protein product, partial [Phaeothamnion confervicola]